MAYLAVDKDGTEIIFEHKPYRCSCTWQPERIPEALSTDYVILPKGTIYKIIGKCLTWEDDAIQIGEAPDTYVQQWINVEDALPKRGVDVF